MPGEILQQHLRFAPWMAEKSRRLPGIMPLDMVDWLQVDEAYSAQLAEKARLIADRPDDVLVLSEGAGSAADELLAFTLDHLASRADFKVGDAVRRPDGVLVPIDRAQPLLTLSRLVQEDLVIMERKGDEHVLTAALLCFPASWTLSEKFMRPLSTIHTPVESYDENIARRVQRMFDAIRPERPLWRANALFYADAGLYHPRREATPRDRSQANRPFIRSERQSLIRLPQTGAVVFSIHTTVIRRTALTEEQAAGLERNLMEDLPT